MEKNLIFVSCGQATEQEKTVGVHVKTMIDASPSLEAYFAETVHDLDALGRNIFDALYRCAGAVIIMHDRGRVIDPGGQEWGHRSSVWINQELAILAYRQFFEGKPIPVLVFVDPEVKLEGAMTSLIVNPYPSILVEDVIPIIKAWLAENRFDSVSDEAFQQKWAQLSDLTREVVACLIGEGGLNVKEAVVRSAMKRVYSVDKNEASEALRKAKIEFVNTGLVNLIPNIHSGHELSLHPTWKFALVRAMAKWSETSDRSDNVPH